MTTLEEIRNHMIEYLSSYHISGHKVYDSDGHCGGFGLDIIKNFWEDFTTDSDFKYLVSGRWDGDLDLDGGRSYLLGGSKVEPLLIDYMINTLKWDLKDYQKNIYNDCTFVEELEWDFDAVLSSKRKKNVKIQMSDTITEDELTKVLVKEIKAKIPGEKVNIWSGLNFDTVPTLKVEPIVKVKELSVLDKILNDLKQELDNYNNPSTYEDEEYYIRCSAKVSAFEDAINIVNKYK